MNLTAAARLLPIVSSAAFTPSFAIIVKGDLAVGGIGVAPRDHEHGEAFAREIFHQRVVGRQIEDIVFHDPGRHDQNRLGVHLFAVVG